MSKEQTSINQDDYTGKQNVLLILADQMTPFLMGAYGHPVVKTPNLDKLTADGVRFDAAYSSSPLCVPARASLMTGKYASRIGCYDNGAPLSCEEPCIAHYLSREGYDAIASGKLHFIGPDQTHGFRKRLTTDIYPSDFSWTPSYENKHQPMFKGKPHASGYAVPNVGVRKWSMGLAYDDETTFRALEYLRARPKKEDQRESGVAPKPFFLCVSYSLPHGPFHVTQELWDLYKGAAIDIPEIPENVEETYSVMDQWLYIYHGIDRITNIRDPESLYSMRRSYFGMVSHVDQQIGELLKALQDTGQADNTVVIFSSDHGDMLGEKGLVQKKMFYEWSARVPLIISFPDGRGRGSTCEEPVSLMDLAPTILDIAGVQSKLPLDGKGLLSLVGEDQPQNREVFSEILAEGVYSPCFMIRRGHYKYIYIHRYDAQLFDLENDPGEWQNLAGMPEYKNLEEELHARISQVFDQNEIEKKTRESIAKRKLIRSAMEVNNTHWDYTPEFSGSQQYIRRDTGPTVNE